jgi:GNAT superfamily N-acetyltransferase
LLSKLRRNLREGGARGTFERGIRRLRQGYTREEVIVLLKTLDAIVEPRKPAPFEVVDLTPEHLSGLFALNRKRGEPEGDRYFENSVAAGFHGFVALTGGEVIGYYWWVDRENPEPHPDTWLLGSEFALEPGDVYGSSLFLLEEHRGGNASGQFLFKIETAFRDRGYKRIWGYVESDNRPARWTYDLRGYKATWRQVNRRFTFIRWRRSFPVE